MLLLNYNGVINKNGDTFTVNDITGEDNLITSTKYATGSTNVNHPKADNIITEMLVTMPDSTVLPLLVYNSLISVVTPNIAATTQLPIPASSFTMNLIASQLGLTNTLFTDGMYRFDTTIWMAIKNSGVGTTLGSDLKTITGTTTFFTVPKTGLGDTKYIKIIKNSDSTKNINSTCTITSDTVLVLDAALTTFVDGDNVTIYAGYKVTFYIKANANLLKCFMPKVAKRSVAKKKCCKTCGQTEIDQLSEMYLAMFDIEAQIDVGMYDIANRNILALGKICRSIECNSEC